MALPLSCSTLSDPKPVQLSQDVFLFFPKCDFLWLERILKLSQGHKLPKPSKPSWTTLFFKQATMTDVVRARVALEVSLR